MRVLIVTVAVVLAIAQLGSAGKKKYCAPGCKKMIADLDMRVSALEERHSWKMVLRAAKGDGGNIVSKWESNAAYNEDQADIAKDLTKTFHGIYKSAMANDWKDIEEVKVAMYNGGEEKAYLIFNGRKSTKMNFFSKDNLLSSSFDIDKTNYFSIKGDDAHNRHFFVSKSYGGCGNDQAWFVVVDDGNTGCSWMEKEALPYFMYSPTADAANQETEAVIADTFAIFVKTRV